MIYVDLDHRYVWWEERLASRTKARRKWNMLRVQHAPEDKRGATTSRHWRTASSIRHTEPLQFHSLSVWRSQQLQACALRSLCSWVWNQEDPADMNRKHWSQSVAGRLVSQAEFIGSTLEKVQSNTWLLLLPTPMEPTGALNESLEPMCRVFANTTGKSKILIPPNPILHVIHFYSCLISLEPKLPVHLISSSWLKETLLLLVLPF